MAKKFTSISGVTIHICRKISKFAFGEENAFAVRYNYPEARYDIYIKETEGLEGQIEWFKEFWGPSFHLIVLPEDQIHSIPSTHGNVPVPS